MKINDDFIKEKTGDECVLVPIGDTYQNGIFTLNEDAEKLFDLLSDGKSRDEIIDFFEKEYEMSRDDVADSVDRFIEKLKETGILIDD